MIYTNVLSSEQVCDTKLAVSSPNTRVYVDFRFTINNNNNNKYIFNFSNIYLFISK